MTRLRAALLEHGTDEEVVENLYLGILGRWPDAGGLAHHLARLRGRPGMRRAVLLDILGSEEARARGAALDMDAPATAEEARGAVQALRFAALRAEVAALRDRPAGTDPELLAELAAQRLELDALRAETRERLAGLQAALAAGLLR